MKVALRLFAGLHDLVGSRNLTLDLREGARISDLKAQLATNYPVVQAVLPTVVFAIDDEYVAQDRELSEGMEVALIPPVSGGGRPDLFLLTTEPLEPLVQDLVDLVRRPESGAVAT